MQRLDQTEEQEAQEYLDVFSEDDVEQLANAKVFANEQTDYDLTTYNEEWVEENETNN